MNQTLTKPVVSMSEATIKAKASDLFDAFGSAILVAPKKNPTMPILENFLVEIDGNLMKVTASNESTRIVATQELSDVSGYIRICIPSHRVFSFLQLVDGIDVISLSFTEKDLTITTQTGDYQFVCESADIYPSYDKYPELVSELFEEELVDSILRLLYACSTEEIRPAMTCVLFNFNDDYAEFIATNGNVAHKLRSKQIKIGKHRVLVPGTNLDKLKKLIKGADDIKIGISQSNIRFGLEDLSFFSGISTEKFPEYEKYFHHENKYSVLIYKELLIKALCRIQVLEPIGDTVRLVFSEGNLSLSAKSDLGEANEKIQIDFEKLEETADDVLTASFYCKRLLSILNHLPFPQLAFQFSEPNKAFFIMPTHNIENREEIVLIQPIYNHDYE